MILQAVQEDQKKLKLNRTYQLLAYIDDINLYIYIYKPCVVGPCHNGMARPQVADGGTASFMEGGCE